MTRQTPDQAKAATHALTAVCVIVPDSASTDRLRNVGAISPTIRSFCQQGISSVFMYLLESLNETYMANKDVNNIKQGFRIVRLMNKDIRFS